MNEARPPFPGRPPTSQRPFIFALGVFLVGLVLAYIFRETLRDLVLTPLLHLIWAVNLAIRSFDQGCLWAASLIVAIVLSLMFSRRTRPPVEETQRFTQRREVAEGRIRFWQFQLRIREGELMGRRSIAWELRRLLVEWLAYRQQTNTEDIIRSARHGQLDLPPEFRYILGLDEAASMMEGGMRRMGRGARWWRRLFSLSEHRDAQPDPRIVRVAEILEHDLEVENEAEG